MLGDLIVRLSAETSNFIVPVKQAHVGLENISGVATNAQFGIDSMAKSMLSVSSASKGLGFVSDRLAAISSFSGLAAAGLMQVSAGVSFIGGAAFKVASSMSLLLIPLEGLMILTRAIIAPFRILISLMMTLAKAAWTAAQPLISMAIFAFKVKVAISGLAIQFKLIWKFLAMLSPQLRIVVLGLTALGLSGRVGAAAMGLFSRAVKVGTVAVLALTNPLAALKMVAISTTMSMIRLTASILSAGRAMAKFAIAGALAGMKALGTAAVSVASKIGGGLVTALMSAAKWAAVIGVGVVGWGVKLFADAEQAEVAFTTMLKSGKAAKRVLGDLEQFAASTPFQLNDLQDGAKQLLNAQVPTTDLTNKLRMLGDIAAGTGKPILDFARIYSKVKSTGKVSLETLNQLAERGVPIYSALATQLGVSRTEMLDMISKGKVGFQDLDAAITATATGSGIFAGGMAAQSQTVAGLFSTLKDNVSFAMRELGMQVSNAFDFKGMLNTGITFFQGLKAGIASALPVFQAVAIAVQAGFSAIWEVASVVFTSIANAMGMTGGNIMQTIMEAMAVVTWVFKSWPDIAQLAFTKMMLYGHVAFESIKHFFTGVVPALLTWFADNWQSIFLTAADLVLTIFINLGENMRSIWSGIMSFISGNGFNVDFTPLTEGFKNSISELPDIPDRAVGELEKNLQASVEAMTNNVAGGLQAEIEKNMALLDAHRNKKPEDLGTDQGTLPDVIAEEGTGQGGQQKQQQQLGVLEKGSSEAFKAILGGQNNPQVKEQKKSNEYLKTIAAAAGGGTTGSSGTMEIKVQGAV